jgi:hypothetical protein
MKKDEELELIQKRKIELEKIIKKKVEPKLQDPVPELKKKFKKTPQEISKENNDKITTEVYDLVFNLIGTSIKIIEKTSHGRSGSVYNLELMNLYNDVVNARRKLLTQYGQVDNQDRLDMIMLKKDFLHFMNMESIKMRSPKTKKRLKDFRI